MTMGFAAGLSIRMGDGTDVFKRSHECSTLSDAGGPVLFLKVWQRLTRALFFIGVVPGLADAFQAQAGRIEARMFADSSIPAKIMPRYSYGKMLHVCLFSCPALPVCR